ncbi:MAG: haloacid dehalogenase-like hydrolase [Ruminococcus sp.]
MIGGSRNLISVKTNLLQINSLQRCQAIAGTPGEVVYMKVFDFDNTIYRGESSVDFAFYMIKHNKKIIKYIPTILFSLIGYKLCLLKKEKLESIINSFFSGILDGTESPDDFVKPFWETHTEKLNNEMLQLISPEDIIISASPSDLIEGISEMLNTKNIIGTELDVKQKRITWFNFGDNKVKRYKELYGARRIDAFYTDSYNDKAMMDISRRVYIVRKGVPKRIT